MKLHLVLAACLTATSAAADDCAARIAALVTGALDMVPSEGRFLTQSTGQPDAITEFLIAGPDHTLFRPVDPAGLDWVLTYGGARYGSQDDGATWTLLQEFDPEAARAAQAENLAAQAESIENAECGTTELDGETVDRLSADMTMPPPAAMAIRAEYWVDPDTGFVRRSVTRMEMQGFVSTVTQDWTPSPGLSLPVPEG
jgi:opacity protein-like surface antigen